MTRPLRLLDLFSGAGGASVGYARAGFEVTAVDIEPMPHYPFLDLIQGDAMVALEDRAFLDEFDAVHTSPPCKPYTSLWHRHKRVWPDLVGAVRERLEAWGGLYVIENVVGAPVRPDLVLCGSMFDLGVGDAILKRHRLFESNVPLTPPGPDACDGKPVVGVYGTGGAWTRTAPGGGGVKVSGADAAAALGITHTTHQAALAQAIPPAYTEHIGRQLAAAITRRHEGINA